MATPTESKTEPTVLTAEEREARIAALPENMQPGIRDLNAQIKQHNANVAIVRAASQDKKSETDTIFELIVKGDYDDSKLKDLQKLILQLEEKLERSKKAALSRAIEIGLKSEDLSADQVKAAHEATKESSSVLRDKEKALIGLGGIFGIDFSGLLEPIDSTRGLRLNTGETGTTTRPQYKAQFIVDSDGNRELIGKEVEKKDKEGNIVKEFRSTSTVTAQELTKRGGKGFSVTSSELNTAFLAAQNLKPNEFDKVTSGHQVEFEITKDVLDSDNNVIGQKSFKLVFEK